MKSKKLRGYIIAIIGLAILLFNALSYILNWEIGKPALPLFCNNKY